LLSSVYSGRGLEPCSRCLAGDNPLYHLVNVGAGRYNTGHARCLERLPAPASAAAPGGDPAVLAVELLSQVRVELPVVGEMGEREQVLVAAWLGSRFSDAMAGPPLATRRGADDPDELPAEVGREPVHQRRGRDDPGQAGGQHPR
jgi:hypothetical protein